MADQTSSRLLDQVHDAIRLKHYSIRTEEADVDWIKRFILFHKTPEGSVRHPQDMGAAEIAAFLTHLGCRQKCCCFYTESSSQGLALLISQCVGARRHLVRRCPARQKAQTPAHGADQRRGAPRAQPDDRYASTSFQDRDWLHKNLLLSASSSELFDSKGVDHMRTWCLAIRL